MKALLSCSLEWKPMIYEKTLNHNSSIYALNMPINTIVIVAVQRRL